MRSGSAPHSSHKRRMGLARGMGATASTGDCAQASNSDWKEWLVRSGMSKRPLCPHPDQPPYGNSGVAADLRWAVGSGRYWDFSQDRLLMTLIPTHRNAKRIPHWRVRNRLLIITNNPNAGHFSDQPLRRVENDPVSPFSLGTVQRHVGTLDHAFGCIHLIVLERYAGGNGNR